MLGLFGYTVLKDSSATDDKPWAIVRIEVREKPEEEGRAIQYIHIVGHHANLHIARYWSTMLHEGGKTEEQVVNALENGGVG